VHRLRWGWHHVLIYVHLILTLIVSIATNNHTTWEQANSSCNVLRQTLSSASHPLIGYHRSSGAVPGILNLVDRRIGPSRSRLVRSKKYEAWNEVESCLTLSRSLATAAKPTIPRRQQHFLQKGEVKTSQSPPLPRECNLASFFWWTGCWEWGAQGEISSTHLNEIGPLLQRRLVWLFSML
jgi:hypothetical protein